MIGRGQDVEGGIALADSQRPQGPALERLRHQLRTLHRQGGEPSFRVIAQRTAKAISHTTVGNVLKCDTTPRWGSLELVVEALGGSIESFRALWIAVKDEMVPLGLSGPSTGAEDESDDLQAAGDLSMRDLEAAEEDLHEHARERSHREGETRRELLAALETRADLSDHLSGLREELGRERGHNQGLRERISALERERDEQNRLVERLQHELRSVREERLLLLEKMNGLSARRAELYFDWARDEERRRRGAENDQEEKRTEIRELSERLGAAEGLLKSVLVERAERDAEPGEAETEQRSDRDRRWFRFSRMP
ncbi:hypothetical protein [Streptomyces atroolivaceus]|uniref:hypothetical protein n=1 Tax=Streptomyces atroolivaceus TaxID=66869 RepID=UPI0020250511|nr:hypothetical protein [Streptomyces atroolivaceus]